MFLIEIMDNLQGNTQNILKHDGKTIGTNHETSGETVGNSSPILCNPDEMYLGKKRETLEFTIWLCQNSYGKSPVLIGKPSVNGPFSIAFCMFTRGYHQRNRIIKQKCHRNPVGLA